MRNRIELLAPAGNWDSFLAAVENGADAVYLGGKQFNARQFAGNFDDVQLKSALDYAHVRGVNVYLTMNTLMSDSEIKEGADFVQKAYLAGIDGLIVQDLGFAGVIRNLFPDLALHGSTQMTVYNLESVKVLEEMGFKRVVLARELNLDEIANISNNTSLETEVFVHGALCICYSGQCLMSSIIGGRSGNRGKCAQPCRMPYEIVEGKKNLEGFMKYSHKAYILSPKDLCYIGELDNLKSAGVQSLKIEGRMKSPEYVATVVSKYKKYVNELSKDFDNDVVHGISIDDLDMKELTQIFNRGGFSLGYLKGKHGKDMMCYEKPKNWGLYIGKVISFDSASKLVKLKLEEDLSIGDGIEVWNGEEESPGTIVTEIRINGRNERSAAKGDVISIGSIKGRISAGNNIYKTSDKRLNTSARASFEGKTVTRTGIKGKVILNNNETLKLFIEDIDGNTVQAEGDIAAEVALNKPLTEERVYEQISKTGATPFVFEELTVNLAPNLSIPISELNTVRRKALEVLEERRKAKYSRNLSKEFEENKKNLFYYPGNSRNVKSQLKTSIFLYDIPEGIALERLDVHRVYLPFTKLIHGKNDKTISDLINGDKEVVAWLPSITRGNYDNIIKENLKGVYDAGVRGFLIGNTGSIKYFDGLTSKKLFGDFSMNCYNSYSIDEFAKLGLSGITLSLELNLNQIKSLESINDITKEAVVYGRIPLMTSEYCPVGSTIGGHKVKQACNGVCSGKSYLLKDRTGTLFPVLCDRVDCRSTILNSNVLFAVDVVDKLQDSGVDSIRLNFYDEKPEEIYELIRVFNTASKKGKEAGKLKDDFVEKIKIRGFNKGHYFRGV